ncbi:hypothetical protein GGI09_007182, partial [Coemansia sp. S100]
MLLSVDELTESDVADSDHSSNSSSASTSTTPAVISWKVLVKCLFDFANSSADALRNKIQSESRHTFALHPDIKPTLPLISALSPFDSGGAPQDAVLAANLHQAHCLKRLVAASPNSAIDSHSTTAVQAKGLYSADLHSWLGAHTGATIVERGKELLWRSTTTIDNTTKHALPKKTMRLGFQASVTCLDGILVIRQAAATNGAGDVIELIWPMADLIVTRVLDEPSDAGHLPTLRLTDTIFPPLFFSPLPQSMGGIPALSLFALSPPLMP